MLLYRSYMNVLLLPAVQFKMCHRELLYRSNINMLNTITRQANKLRATTYYYFAEIRDYQSEIKLKSLTYLAVWMWIGTTHDGTSIFKYLSQSNRKQKDFKTFAVGQVNILPKFQLSYTWKFWKNYYANRNWIYQQKWTLEKNVIASYYSATQMA